MSELTPFEHLQRTVANQAEMLRKISEVLSPVIGRDLAAVAQARVVLAEYSEAIEQVRAWNRSDIARKIDPDPIYTALDKLAEILEVKEGE